MAKRTVDPQVKAATIAGDATVEAAEITGRYSIFVAIITVVIGSLVAYRCSSPESPKKGTELTGLQRTEALRGLTQLLRTGFGTNTVGISYVGFLNDPESMGDGADLDTGSEAVRELIDPRPDQLASQTDLAGPIGMRTATVVRRSHIPAQGGTSADHQQAAAALRRDSVRTAIQTDQRYSRR
jgi:hypothetical protein